MQNWAKISIYKKKNLYENYSSSSIMIVFFFNFSILVKNRACPLRFRFRPFAVPSGSGSVRFRFWFCPVPVPVPSGSVRFRFRFHPVPVPSRFLHQLLHQLRYHFFLTSGEVLYMVATVSSKPSIWHLSWVKFQVWFAI